MFQLIKYFQYINKKDIFSGDENVNFTAVLCCPLPVLCHCSSGGGNK